MSAPGSAAAVAGLKGAKISRNGSITPGDIIVALDDQPIVSVEELLSRLDNYKVGDIVQITILRKDNEITVPVTLQAGI